MSARSKMLALAAATFGLALLAGLSIAAQLGKPMLFASPQRAVDAFVSAMRKGDVFTLEAVLGPDGKDIIYSGDAQADKATRDAFLAAYDEKSSLENRDATHVILDIGKDDWPLPIPIVKQGAGWRFDTVAGKRELLARRIGRNELFAIQSCLAFVDAQRDYAAVDRGDGVLDYAQRFISSEGKHDGLYWATKEGEPESPLGPAFAEAQASGFMSKTLTPGVSGRVPFHGYYFKILTSQGPAATGGAYDYLVKGKMIGGYALVAYPATYGNSGITTFMVNQDGVVYQQDLGSNTPTLAPKIAQFNPAKGWTKVDNTAPPAQMDRPAPSQ